MNSNKNCCKWKSIIIHYDSKTEVIQFDLDDKQRLIKKMKRQKKRSLISKSPHLEDERLKRTLIKKIISSNSKKQIFNLESISFNENIQKKPTYIENDHNFLYNMFKEPLENNELNAFDKSELAEIDNLEEFDLYFDDNLYQQ